MTSSLSPHPSRIGAKTQRKHCPHAGTVGQPAFLNMPVVRFKEPFRYRMVISIKFVFVRIKVAFCLFTSTSQTHDGDLKSMPAVTKERMLDCEYLLLLIGSEYTLSIIISKRRLSSFTFPPVIEASLKHYHSVLRAASRLMAERPI